MLVCIISAWNNIAFSSKVDLNFSGFTIWDGLSRQVVYWDYLGLIAFYIVNIISLTSAGRAFEHLEKEIQIKNFRRFQVFVLCNKSQCEKMGTTQNLEK